MSDDLRDAIASLLSIRTRLQSLYQADAVLALPEMVARERVIEAARAVGRGEIGSIKALNAAVAALDALEGS